MLLADISVERFRAKKDVAYERYKAGEEKQIQDMREAIISSKETTGQLTQELSSAKEIIEKQNADLKSLLGAIEINKSNITEKEDQLKDSSEKLDTLIRNNSDMKSRLDVVSKENQELRNTIQNIDAKHEESKVRLRNDALTFYNDLLSLQEFYEYFKDDIYSQMRKNGMSDDTSILFINKIKEINHKYRKSNEKN